MKPDPPAGPGCWGPQLLRSECDTITHASENGARGRWQKCCGCWVACTENHTCVQQVLPDPATALLFVNDSTLQLRIRSGAQAVDMYRERY